MDEIQKETGREIDFNNLIYYFKRPNIAPINFVRFKGSLHIFEHIKNGNMSLQKEKKNQNEFESKLGEVK